MMYISGNKERCVQIAAYMIENNATVRSAAKKFGISKSTVHKDVTQTLRQINKPLYFEVKKVLETNKRERHIRGGEATRKKYSAMSGKDTGNTSGRSQSQAQ
jgi:putative DeoR family transcriptional regulator (stage III sporulation protein D)